MSEDLVAFIRARLDEDEAAAKRVQEDVARAEAGDYGLGGAQYLAPKRSAWRELGHDPARVLREVEAIRAIVDLHELMDDPADYDDGAAPCLCEELWPCATIKAVAGIWQDHPDYAALLLVK